VKIAKHDETVASMDSNTAICYSDGSASPNPGPCGAGASIFICNPDRVFDFGSSLGRNTNNFAELFALGVIFTELGKIQSSFPQIRSAVVFSDSKLALNATTSKTVPRSNGPITRAVRQAFVGLSSKMRVNLQWIRGHVSVGGNERVDRISKRFATVANNDFLSRFNDVFTSQPSSSPWPSFPLSALPTCVFLTNLPSPLAIPVVPAVPRLPSPPALRPRSSVRVAFNSRPGVCLTF
jgi:ribonuclease HI